MWFDEAYHPVLRRDWCHAFTSADGRWHAAVYERGYRLFEKVVRAKEVLGFSLQELHTYIAMADVLNEQRFDYQQTTEVKDRIEKLTSMDETLGGQLQLIEQKLQSIHAVQAELEELRERVQNGIQRLQKNEITEHPEDG